MANFSEIPWIKEHIELYRTDPEKAHMWDSTPLGGPRRYAEKFGPIRIPAAHAHLRIGRDDRNAWLACMREAIALQPFAPDFAAYLLEQLAIPADRVLQASRDPL